jgi:antirestriction protein ArdC
MDRTTALAALKDGVASLANSEAFQAYLKVSAKFHSYSWRNRIMIAMQRPDASHVAGFNKWKELGRWVRKGEKGIAIFAPLTYSKKDEATGEKTGEFIRGFRIVHVFDVAQTDGAPIPAMPMPEQLTGNHDGGIFTALLDFAMRGGLSVLPAFDAFEDERNGDYSPAQKQIRIRSGLSILQRAKTMAHECAHWILHTSPEGGALPREVKETEAEAAAFLALARFGFPSDAYSFAYIAGWAQGDVKILEASLERINKAADEIAYAVESRLAEANAEPAIMAAEPASV